MNHKEEMVVGTDELTDAVQVVAETFPHVAHLPQGSDWYRWLIWKDQTSERLGIIALDGSKEMPYRRQESSAAFSCNRASRNAG